MESNKLVWEALTADGEVYTPRTGHTVAVHKSSLYVFAGTDDTFRQNDMYQYNATDQKWSKVSMTGEMPPPRSGGQSITYKDFIFVFGGYAKKVGEYYNDLYKFDINAKKWMRVSTKGALSPRVDHAFAVFHESAYVFGGTDGKRKLRDLQELSLERAEWRQLPYKDIWPSARFGHSYVSYQDSLYLFGGWDGTITLNDFWRYTPSLQAWKQISARTAIASRYRHIAVTFDNAMYIFGGVDKDQERFGDLLEYDFHESSWKRIIPANEGPSARTFHRAGVIDKHLYIVGGFDGTRLNDLHKINLENVVPINEFSCNTLSTSSLILTPETNNPQEFIDFTKSYSELKALMKKAVGQIRFQKLPVNRWFAFLPKTENYSARTGHTAALVDNKIYLFAGVDAGGAVSNDFSVFDLQMETWSKVKSEGKVPSARSGCKCIQDRHLIYFFGGYTTKSANIKEYFHDMYCFDTINNNWREIVYNLKSSQMPTKRTDHSLVFYNDSLYVFGGKGAKEEIFRDFFRFNINSRIWTEIKGERAILEPSFGHSATVYQDSMYVFGGWDGKVCLDDFYQYSFNTNIWYNLKRSSGEKPSPRYRHDALEYLGSLYIFGGVNAGQIRFSDFYQYNFDLRQWLCIKVSGCMPSPRTFHKIVNYENIIFLLGGFDGERKNDMHIISVEQTVTKPLSRKFLEFEEPTQIQPQLTVSVIINDYKKEPPSQHLIKMLNEQVLELSQKLQKEEERHLCKICFTREIDALILECCHFVSCFSCSSSLKHCPICREEIVKIVQTYKS